MTTFYYKLRVNINGFKLDDIKIALLVDNKIYKPPAINDTNDIKKAQIRINATRFQKTGKNNLDSITKEFEKFYDILAKQNQIKLNTMRYYLDKTNSSILIIEFEKSENDENVYVNLDDSCESLVEAAARSLVNVKNIDDIRHLIENPNLSNQNNMIDDIFSPSILRDLNQASNTKLTPINIIENEKTGKKIVRINVDIPNGVDTVSLAQKETENNNDELTNHLTISMDGLKLYLNALTTNQEVTNLKNSTKSYSSFNKQLNLPKGTDIKNFKYALKLDKQQLLIEAPFYDVTSNSN